MINFPLKEFIQNNPKLVRMKQSERYPDLYTVKYKNKVFYDNLWHVNDFLLDCRGLVVDDTYDPVVMPFRKIFNFHENDTVIPRDENVTAVRKVNGFMAAVTHTEEHGVIVSTTGSLDSNFVDRAKEILPLDVDYRHFRGLSFQPTTWLFEIVHPDDPHVVPEEVGAYLLGGRYVDWGKNRMILCQSYLDEMAEDFGVKRPEWIESIRFSDLVNMNQTVKHEGFVVYGEETHLKLKSPYYKITKLLGRMKDERLENLVDMPKPNVEEEYYPLLQFIKRNKDIFLSATEQQKMKMIRMYIDKENLLP